MNVRVISGLIGLAALAASSLGAGPATQPVTKPATTSPAAANPDVPELTVRQRNLLMQLADAEANIQATNVALRRIGYRVGQAYDRIDSNLKGNELMDRKGGGPVRWDEFYGKTARDFVMHDVGSPVYHPVQRPRQFDFIYRANNDQVSRAREQISTVAQDQVVLLARRQKHEADQSLLWATIAWEQVKDREIDDHAICRYALKPRGAGVAALRPVVLFLRVADRVATDGLESVQADQAAAFQAGSQRMEAAFTSLRGSLADALDAGDLKPEQRKQGLALKAMCKGLAEDCKVIADNYANALDRDRAKQDTSKLEFRRELQKSLGAFAAAVGQLDDEVAATAAAWGVEADRGVLAQDSVPKAPTVATQSGTGKAPAEVVVPAANRRADEGTKGWVDLFNGKDLSGWEAAPGGKGVTWRVVDGVITGSGRQGYLGTTKSDYANFELRVEARVGAGGNSGVFFRVTDPAADLGGYQAQISDSTDGDVMKTGSLRYYGAKKQGRPIGSVPLKKSPVAPGEWFTTEVIANGPRIIIKVDGKETVDFTDVDNLPTKGRISLECFHCNRIEFRKVQIRELVAPQK